MVNTMIMSPASLHVVISQGQSRNPEKRGLETAIATFAAQLPKTTVLSLQHLYDLTAEGESATKLRSIPGPIVVLSWLFPRAAHWTLDRIHVRGQTGEVLLNQEEEDDEEEEESAVEASKEDKVIHSAPRPDRNIYCIDLRASESAEAFFDELRRIHALEIDSDEALTMPATLASVALPFVQADIQKIEEHPARRWYPVIDYSRCTNCMECIDFCLFGVYGVDGAETILVEQPDNCRKGCPACSRVCPANAIMFPQHKTPAIAGSEVDMGGFKIDLSKLFGAPERNEDAVAAAARERDEQLILAGRAAVGEGIVRVESTTAPWEASDATSTSVIKPKDDFDRLIDQLDELDL
jgi:NAD-dependent dihydropyrimidine dehydrogenase PreA subunit